MANLVNSAHLRCAADSAPQWAMNSPSHATVAVINVLKNVQTECNILNTSSTLIKVTKTE